MARRQPFRELPSPTRSWSPTTARPMRSRPQSPIPSLPSSPAPAGPARVRAPRAAAARSSDVVDLPVGASVTYVVSATIASAATGALANTATVAAAPGTTDPIPANNSATDTDTLTPRSDLAITKTDAASTAVPGTPVTYTVVVANNGPSDVVGASVIDAFPANLSNATWSCVVVGGTLPCRPVPATSTQPSTSSAGGTATFTVTADIAATATGTLSNTATVVAPPATTDLEPRQRLRHRCRHADTAGRPVGHQDRQRPRRPAR